MVTLAMPSHLPVPAPLFMFWGNEQLNLRQHCPPRLQEESTVKILPHFPTPGAQAIRSQAHAHSDKPFSVAEDSCFPRTRMTPLSLI